MDLFESGRDFGGYVELFSLVLEACGIALGFSSLGTSVSWTPIQLGHRLYFSERVLTPVSVAVC